MKRLILILIIISSLLVFPMFANACSIYVVSRADDVLIKNEISVVLKWEIKDGFLYITAPNRSYIYNMKYVENIKFTNCEER